MIRPTLGLDQPPLQWVIRVLSSGVRWTECKADHLPLSSVKDENWQSYVSTLPGTKLTSYVLFSSGQKYPHNTKRDILYTPFNIIKLMNDGE